MRRASAQIFSIGSHRKKHFSFGFRCGILSLVCRCFLKNSILYTENLKIRIKYSFFHCRSPHGERGLKSCGGYQVRFIDLSLPTRGAWIEMVCTGVASFWRLDLRCPATLDRTYIFSMSALFFCRNSGVNSTSILRRVSP